MVEISEKGVERSIHDVVATIEAGEFYTDYDQSATDLAILRRAAAALTPQPSGPVGALEAALRGLLKAYEKAFDWTAELPPETVEAERIANEALEALSALTAGKPEQAVPTHRHKTRGTEYMLIGIGRMQAKEWFEGSDRDDYWGGVSSIDMREVASTRV